LPHCRAPICKLNKRICKNASTAKGRFAKYFQLAT